MEKITKPTVTDIPSLKALAENYIKWGEEFEQKLKNGGKSSNFSWKGRLYEAMRKELCLVTKNHCSFCDDYPIGRQSTKEIEHYFPKEKYPLMAYDWNNLFYCCHMCNIDANKTKFLPTLKPDDTSYEFETYFWFDLQSGELKVYENLEQDNPNHFAKANAFLARYGINTPTRTSVRKDIFKDIKNHFIAKSLTDDYRIRDDFAYRYIYDYCIAQMKLK